MSDLYLKLAHSPITDRVIDSLSLPRPPLLERSPNDSLSGPKGNVLLASLHGSTIAASLAQAFKIDSALLFTPFQDKQTKRYFTTQINQQAGFSPKSFNFDDPTRMTFGSIVLDVSGLQSVRNLKALYVFFKRAVNHLKPNARIVIIGIAPDAIADVEAATAAASLEGFTRSLAKETGKEGVCCNLIQLVNGGEKHIAGPLYYLLSAKSAFVTGQILQVGSTRNMPRKLNWESPPLQGKLAVVTGAAQGIGAETCRVLARDGATVLAVDLPTKEHQLKALNAQIGGHTLCLDLGDANAPAQLAATLCSQLGVIDILVHNAGITRDKTLRKMPEPFWDQAIDINLSKILQINRMLLEQKAFNTRGRIVCVSSIAGIAGNFGQTNYAAAKAGLAGYVQAAARQSENGMTFNAVAPGFIETEMTAAMPMLNREMGRRANTLNQGGLPLDVAEAVAFFCHPAAQAVNGNVLRVCGQSLLGR